MMMKRMVENINRRRKLKLERKDKKSYQQIQKGNNRTTMNEVVEEMITRRLLKNNFGVNLEQKVARQSFI